MGFGFEGVGDKMESDCAQMNVWCKSEKEKHGRRRELRRGVLRDAERYYGNREGE